MDEEIQIINSNTRNEKIKNFFINNKKKFFIGFIIIVIIVISFFLYFELEKRRTIKLSNKYDKAVMIFNSGNETLATQNLKEIIKEKDKIYSPLSLYFLIDNNLINSREETNNFFDLLINKTGADKEIKNLIIYKKALFNSEFENENNLLKILNPLINSESVWKSHALYLLGEYFYSKGEKQKSKEFFSKILELESSNQKIKFNTQRKIRSYFSD